MACGLSYKAAFSAMYAGRQHLLRPRLQAGNQQRGVFLLMLTFARIRSLNASSRLLTGGMLPPSLCVVVVAAVAFDVVCCPS